MAYCDMYKFIFITVVPPITSRNSHTMLKYSHFLIYVISVEHDKIYIILILTLMCLHDQYNRKQGRHLNGRWQQKLHIIQLCRTMGRVIQVWERGARHVLSQSHSSFHFPCINSVCSLNFILCGKHMASVQKEHNTTTWPLHHWNGQWINFLSLGQWGIPHLQQMKTKNQIT